MPTDSPVEPVVSPLVVGAKIKDNDPRVNGTRILKVKQLTVSYAFAEDIHSHRTYRVARHRIYGDGKVRRSGFSIVG